MSITWGDRTEMEYYNREREKISLLSNVELDNKEKEINSNIFDLEHRLLISSELFDRLYIERIGSSLCSTIKSDKSKSEDKAEDFISSIMKDIVNTQFHLRQYKNLLQFINERKNKAKGL